MKIFERVGVDSVVAKRRVVSHVETTAGKIDCEYFVNCAGMVSIESFYLLDSSLFKVSFLTKISYYS